MRSNVPYHPKGASQAEARAKAPLIVNMSDDPQPIPVLEYRTPTPTPFASRVKPTLPFFSALNWAAFLGASWTWCIGMFLPVLLIRDYGPSMWWAFAVPNVIGAAAMGWILRG